MPPKAKTTTTPATAPTAVPEAFETHKLPVPTWVLRCPALHPWARGLLEIRKAWLHQHQLPASLAEVAHECNVWVRACNRSLGYYLEQTDPDHFDYEDDGYFISKLLNPPQALLDAAPGFARHEMKQAIRQYAPLSRLLTEEEKAGLVTEKDKEAELKYWRSEPYGIVDWIDGAGLFSPTSPDSWVVWTRNEMAKLLYLVAWCGRSLHELVPPEMSPFNSAYKWEEAATQDPRRVPLLAWVAQHEDFFGPATTALFRRARAQVVAATLTSGLLPMSLEGEEQQEQELATALRRSARISSSGKAVEAGVSPALRDAVFGIPLLVQTIAEFA